MLALGAAKGKSSCLSKFLIVLLDGTLIAKVFKFEVAILLIDLFLIFDYYCQCSWPKFFG